MKCQECGGQDLSWDLATSMVPYVMDGRLNSHEVNAVLILGCVECSATVRIVRDISEVQVFLRGES